MTFPIIDTLITIGCIFGLYFGAEWIVNSAVRIARKLGMSPLVIGLTIVAIGTSAPEFAVTISSAMRNQADISVGNIVGSNIFNIGFILGGIAMVKLIPTSRTLVTRDGGMLVGTTALLIYFMSDGQLQTWEGILFLVILTSYVFYLIYQKEEFDEELDDEPFKRTDIFLFVLGCAVVIGSSTLFVDAASNIARYFGVSDWVIGVTIVAFGTSAPEIATSAVALLRGNADISAGNLVGSNMFNLLGVLGLAAILNPSMRIDPGAQESSWILLIFTVVVVWMMYTKWEISRLEGAFLFLLASISWFLSFSNISIFSLISG